MSYQIRTRQEEHVMVYEIGWPRNDDVWQPHFSVRAGNHEHGVSLYRHEYTESQKQFEFSSYIYSDELNALIEVLQEAVRVAKQRDIDYDKKTENEVPDTSGMELKQGDYAIPRKELVVWMEKGKFTQFEHYDRDWKHHVWTPYLRVGDTNYFLARMDLADQVRSGHGIHEHKDLKAVFLKEARESYGALVTSDTIFIIDSATDG